MFITVIEKTAAEITICRFQRSRGALLFLRGVRQRLEAEEDVAAILASWRSECSQDRVVVALPPGLFAMRELELPIVDRKKGREIISLELKGELVAEADEQVFEMLPLAGGKTAAIWGSSKLLAAEIASFAAAGFEPEVVTTAMFCWQQLLPENSGPVAAITDGAAVAVYLDKKPLFFRVLPPAGRNQLDATIAALELAKDVRVETVFTIGGTPVATDLGTTPLPLTGGTAAAFAGDNSAAADLAAHYAMARELVAGDPVNLRRGGLTFTGARDRLRRRLRLTLALAVVLLVLVFAEAATRFILVKRDVASLDKSVSLIYREIFPTRLKAVDEVAEVKAELRRLGATDGAGLLAVLKQLAEAKGDDPREIYELDLDGGQVSGRGYDRSAQGVNEFKAKVAPLFSVFDGSEIKSRPDGSVSFAFRGTLKGGGK